MPNLLQTAAVAKLLRVSSERVRQLANSGRLPHSRIGTFRVYDRAEVLKLRAEREKEKR